MIHYGHVDPSQLIPSRRPFSADFTGFHDAVRLADLVEGEDARRMYTSAWLSPNARTLMTTSPSFGSGLEISV
jgi:hypothetical protein